MSHPTTQINAAELIERLERMRDEWNVKAGNCDKKQQPVSGTTARYTAEGIDAAIEEIKDLAKW